MKCAALPVVSLLHPVFRRLLLAVLAVLGCAGSYAAESPWLVRVWTAEGLSDRHILGVVQTADGFLWVATRRALARFDGARFEEFRLSDLAPVEDRPLRALVASRSGGFWVANDHGQVVRFSPAGLRVFAQELPRAAPDFAVEDGAGALWVSFPSGTVCRIAGEGVTTFGREAGLGVGRVVLGTDRTGQVWFTHNNQMGVFHDGRFETLRPRVVSSLRLAAAAEGGMWGADSAGVVRYPGGNTVRRVTPWGALGAAGRPIKLLEDRSGALWIGTTPDGLFRSTAAGGLERVPTSFPEITSLTEDREGNLWVGTAGGGLNRVSPRAITSEGDSTGLPQETIQSICEDRDGKFWAATQNGALMERVDGRWQVRLDATAALTCVVADPRGGLWLGTRKRAFYHWQDGRLETWSQDRGLAGHTVGLVVVARDGTVWLGLEGEAGVQCLREGRLTSVPLPAGVTRLQAMTEDAAGRIWIGCDAGRLLRVEDGRLVEVTPPGAPRVTIRTLHAAADGALWLGYKGEGLGRWKDGRFTSVRAEQGLFSNQVSYLVGDTRGWLWCAGDDGVFKIRLQALGEVADGRSPRVQSVHYGLGQGLPALQVTTRAWGAPLLSRDGRVWLPLSPALLVVDPARTREDLEPPPVWLTHVRADSRLIASYPGVLAPPGRTLPAGAARLPAATLVLPPVRQRIDLAFTAPGFSAPENVHFRHRLEGYEDDWSEAGPLRTASYPAVPAGTYRFRVQACNGDGIWNETGATLALLVTPFYWQTWWFRSAAVAGFIAVIAALVRAVSHRRLRRRLAAMRQQVAIEQERARIARDLHDDAGNRLTRIVLLSQLALRHRGGPQEGGHLEQLSTAAREATDVLDEIVWAVNPGNDTLADMIAYLGRFAVELLTAAGIGCELEIPEHSPARRLGADVRHNLFLAVKEALHNVVRHSRATRATLGVIVSETMLVIVVSDNGCGRALDPAAPGADGLRNMRLRMDTIGGELKTESQPGAGARLSFTYRWPGSK